MSKSNEKQEYSLKELSDVSNTSPRTIRYYISIDLLPPPIRVGRDAAYTHLHIKLLKEIRVKKQQGYTLNEIKRLLSTDKDEEMVPEPISWQSYELSDHVHVDIRSDTPPWVLKSILKNIQNMTQELQNVEE